MMTDNVVDLNEWKNNKAESELNELEEKLRKVVKDVFEQTSREVESFNPNPVTMTMLHDVNSIGQVLACLVISLDGMGLREDADELNDFLHRFLSNNNGQYF